MLTLYHVPADLTKARVDAPVRLKKVSRWNIPAQLNCENEIEAVASRNGRSSALGNEGKHESRKIVNVLSTDKVHLLLFCYELIFPLFN